MLSETIAHLTRKIAEELDLLAGRQRPLVGASREIEAVRGMAPPVVGDPVASAPAAGVPAAGAPATESGLDHHQVTTSALELTDPAPPAERRRSLREILDWRRYKVN